MEMPGPAELAREYGVSGMRIRGFLREHYPQDAPGTGGRWVLRPDQVAAVRAYFSGRSTDPSSSVTLAATTDPSTSATPAVPDVTPSATYHEAWYWEGGVQAAIATHLARLGWRILAVADTAKKVRGDDILARMGGVVLRVEVKGWPSSGVYADERRAGEVKRTQPSVQAGHWYSQALLRALRNLHAHPGDAVAIGLPDLSRYRRLIDETRGPLERLGVGILLVREDGAVETLLPHARRAAVTRGGSDAPGG